MDLESASLAAAALLAPVGVLFMCSCRTAWFMFLDTKRFRDCKHDLKSADILPLLGALVSNYVFLFAAMIFGLGLVSALARSTIFVKLHVPNIPDPAFSFPRCTTWIRVSGWP